MADPSRAAHHGSEKAANALAPIEETRREQAAFTTASHDVALLVLEVLEAKLGLPSGALMEKHSRSLCSGDQIRLTRSRARPPHEGKDDDTGGTLNLGAHTDEYPQAGMRRGDNSIFSDYDAR